MPDTRTRIYRSRDDRMIAGVAGGLARYLGVDPVIVRLAFIALAFAAAGVLAYIVAWIVIPEEPADGPHAPEGTGPETRTTDAGQGARLLFGTVLIAIGGMMLLDWAIPSLDRFFWPMMLIVLGGAFLVMGARR
ncbi:MAG: PspC domain-containing protein [Acidimicrobiia bacterium]|nr:PspC domain-containing protein [Acidimicrobiia bacterium]